ncbi:MAG TPA: DinB family protein [Acidimicrobiia bacterium]|nr:DinB family protein [Acidimicrobiia bacterium]
MTDGALGGQADERELLTGFLDWYRAVVARKVDGLSWEEASRHMTASGLTPLGVVKHLAWVERHWFQRRFAGLELDLHSGPENAPTFELGPSDTVVSVVDDYAVATEESRAVTAGASLDDVSVHPHPIFGPVTLRWVLVHLLEETARHAGHLDVMREALDGRTGD